MDSARGPLKRTIPIPLSPKGVEIAAIVSWLFSELPLKERGEELLFNGFDSFPRFFPGEDGDLLQGPFTNALYFHQGILLQSQMNDPSLLSIERTYCNRFSFIYRPFTQSTGQLSQELPSPLSITTNVQHNPDGFLHPSIDHPTGEGLTCLQGTTMSFNQNTLIVFFDLKIETSYLKIPPDFCSTPILPNKANKLFYCYFNMLQLTSPQLCLVI